MSIEAYQTPVSETLCPSDETGVAEAVRRTAAERSAVYPVGGGTAPGCGTPPLRPGIGLSTSQLARLVDHAADDMTVTVESGMTLAELGRLLGAKNQCLPLDVCRPGEATVGGLAATNFYGPRRYGCGTMRDYVLGLRAVDGRGDVFSAGGRVVKNAAGYNLCRMMVGSRGTLGVITQVTLMVRPIPESSAVVACDLEDLPEAEARLAALVTSQTRPVSIDLCAGRARPDCPLPGAGAGGAAARLLVGFEGSRPEVDWMVEQLGKEWGEAGIDRPTVSLADEAVSLWQWLTEFDAEVRIHVRPGAMVAAMAALLELDPGATVEAHAGDGVIRARFSPREPAEWPEWISHRVRPLVDRAGGRIVVTSAPEGVALERDAVWGPAGDGRRISQAIKEGFDPHGILNPGRYVFDG
jgi:glycolate oxidase FAD binding subunit